MKRLALILYVLVALLALKRTVSVRREGLGLTADFYERDTARGLALAGAAFVGVRLLTGSDLLAALILILALWASGVGAFGLGELGLYVPPFPGAGQVEGEPGDVQEITLYYPPR